MLAEYIRALPDMLRTNVFMVYDHRDANAAVWVEPRLGIRTTNESKHTMTMLIRCLLGTVLRMEHNQTLCLPYAPPDDPDNPAPTAESTALATQRATDEFKRQLNMFEKITSRSNTAEIAKFTYNGKANGQQDDIVCALLMLGRAFQYIFTCNAPECMEARAMALA